VLAPGQELLCRVQFHFVLLAGYECANAITNLDRGDAGIRD